MYTVSVYIPYFAAGGYVDFNSASQTISITAGTNSSIIGIAVINDNVVEGEEMFTMSLVIPSSLGPGIISGATAIATAFIIDTSSMLQYVAAKL